MAVIVLIVLAMIVVLVVVEDVNVVLVVIGTVKLILAVVRSVLGIFDLAEDKIGVVPSILGYSVMASVSLFSLFFGITIALVVFTDVIGSKPVAVKNEVSILLLVSCSSVLFCCSCLLITHCSLTIDPTLLRLTLLIPLILTN